MNKMNDKFRNRNSIYGSHKWTRLISSTEMERQSLGIENQTDN